jgi:cold shock CspA family protein
MIGFGGGAKPEAAAKAKDEAVEQAPVVAAVAAPVAAVAGAFSMFGFGGGAKPEAMPEAEGGTVLSWNPKGGSGFIEPFDGGAKIACAAASIEDGNALRQGDPVTYTRGKDEQGKEHAVQVKGGITLGPRPDTPVSVSPPKKEAAAAKAQEAVAAPPPAKPAFSMFGFGGGGQDEDEAVAKAKGEAVEQAPVDGASPVKMRAGPAAAVAAAAAAASSVAAVMPKELPSLDDLNPFKGFKSVFGGVDLSDKGLEDAFKGLDTDGSGKCSNAELEAYIRQVTDCH